MMNFSEWIACELTAAKAAIDEIPLDKRKGFGVALIRLRARELTTALQINDQYEIWRQLTAQLETAEDQVSI